MPRRISLLVVLCVLAALAGCSSGDSDEAKTTTASTTAGAPELPALTAAESRRVAGELLDGWSRHIVVAAKTLQEREAAANKGLRDAYYKADARLRASIAKIDEFPAQSKRAAARWPSESLRIAVAADAAAWKDWGDGILDIRAAAATGKTPDDLSQTSLLSHLAAYRAAARTAPRNFRQASQFVKPRQPSAFGG